MGYELDRLMQQYGLSSPTVGTYQGDPANTAERAAFDKYKSDFTGRINITPQYMQDQYQTKKPDYNYLQTNPDVGAAYTSSGSTLSPEGFARQHYLNYGQYEGRTMPMLQGGQYWGNTLQAPNITPYSPPEPPAPKPPKSPPPSSLGGWGSKPIKGGGFLGGGDTFTGGPQDNYNYGANPVLNIALVRAAPELKELMPGGFGGGAFNTAYKSLSDARRSIIDGILARGYSRGGPVTVQDQAEQPEPVAQPDMRDELRQRYSDIDAMRQKYIGDTQSLIAQEQESLRNPDQSEKWLRLAAAFSKPTKTGSFFESLGNATESLAENAAIQRANRTKALELAIKSNQMGLEGAEAGLKSYGDLAEMDMNYRNRQMMMDAYLSNDPAMISRAGALTGNPQAVAYGGQLQTQRLADAKLETVYDEQGRAVKKTVGELRGAASGLPSMGGGQTAPQQPQLGQSQASGQGVSVPTQYFAEPTPEAAKKLAVSKNRAVKKNDEAVKRETEYNTLGTAARTNIAGSNRALEILKNAETGPLTPLGNIVSSSLNQSLGWAGVKLDPNVTATKTIDTILGQQALSKMVESLKGSTTEGEQARMRELEGTIKERNIPLANIISVNKEVETRKVITQDLVNRWINENGGIDEPNRNGFSFDEVLAAKISKRPFLDKILLGDQQ